MARTKLPARRYHPIFKDSDTTPAPAPGTRQTLQPKPRYSCSCNSDAAAGPTNAQCSVKRCIEPLAWNLEHDSVVVQTSSPLFATIPKELRDLIFEYALTESESSEAAQVETNEASTISGRRRHHERYQRRDIAGNLQLTCRAVYLETFLLPILLNPIRFEGFHRNTRFMPKAMLPWQFANIQALDFTLPQVALEGDGLYDFLFGPMGWYPEARHEGVLVAPYVGLKNTNGGTCRSCDFTLLPTGADTDQCPLTDALNQTHLPSGFVSPPSAMRLQRARPLVHLTLRLSARHWWTWTDDPSSTDALHHHLGLEPALGNGSADLSQRPTSTRMQELARQRHDGDHPTPRSLLSNHPPGWAHIIAKLPDLKTFELVLETFGEKKYQLEKVVECAKTWRFPIANTQHELAWDTRVEEKRWSKPVIKDWEFQRGYWYARSTEFEVRTVRFTRRQIAPKATDENCKVH